jgi:nucleoside-diphosphate-sugar epimerase
MVEPGLDLHEWATRWQELEDMAADEPAETLPEMVRFVEQMLRARNIPLDDRVTAEGDDPDITRDFLAARDVADAVAAGGADPEDLMVARDNLREIYEYLITDRAAP